MPTIVRFLYEYFSRDMSDHKNSLDIFGPAFKSREGVTNDWHKIIMHANPVNFACFTLGSRIPGIR